MAEVHTKANPDQPSHHFPDDVLMEIFLKLPVSSIFLFKSVSKHWLNVIQNPNFTIMHFNRTVNNSINHNHMLIMRTVESKSRFLNHKIVSTLLSSDNDDVALKFLSPSMASRVSSSRNLRFEEGKLQLLGPCNGVFCITDTVDVVLLNPATRRCKKVPHSPFSPRGCYVSDDFGYFDYVGFGFDPASNDYKIVTFGDGDSDGYFHDVHFKAGIFDLNTNSWRELECVMPAGKISIIHNGSLFFNGALHWLGGKNENFCAILVFDLNIESFKRFELPKKYFQEDSIRVYLSVLNESLTMIVKKEDNYKEPDVLFEIWVMREYGVKKSWRKLYNIGPDTRIERPLSFSENEEFLVENFHGQLLSYNLKTKVIKDFQVNGYQGSLHAFRYRESLVSLK